MGPKDTWTPLHADVFRSYSWSINICGRKKWILFPPKDVEYLKDKNGNTIYNIQSQIDNQKFPNYYKTTPIVCIQEAGETIFVPSNWWHQVHNLEDTISINHNWANACNMDLMWNFLKKELEAVQSAISDCKVTQTPQEWFSQCQELMRMNTGMNVIDFCDMLRIIIEESIEKLKSTTIQKFLQYNLMVAKTIIEDILTMEYIHFLNQENQH